MIPPNMTSDEQEAFRAGVEWMRKVVVAACEDAAHEAWDGADEIWELQRLIAAIPPPALPKPCFGILGEG